MRALLLAAALAVPSAAPAQLLTEKVLPLKLALQAAETAIATCEASGFHVSVAIVDRYGNQRLLLVSDRGAFGPAESARRKAMAANAFMRPTSDIAKAMAANPAMAAPGDGNPNFLFLPGGLPIKTGTDTIAGIGVGGAASSQDEKCAQSGLDAIQGSLR